MSDINKPFTVKIESALMKRARISALENDQKIRDWVADAIRLKLATDSEDSARSLAA